MVYFLCNLAGIWICLLGQLRPQTGGKLVDALPFEPGNVVDVGIDDPLAGEKCRLTGHQGHRRSVASYLATSPAFRVCLVGSEMSRKAK